MLFLSQHPNFGTNVVHNTCNILWFCLTLSSSSLTTVRRLCVMKYYYPQTIWYAPRLPHHYKERNAVDKISQNAKVYKSHSFNFPSKHDRFLLCTDSNLPPFTRAIICIKISFRGGTKIKFLIPYRFPVRPAIDVDECFRSLILF